MQKIPDDGILFAEFCLSCGFRSPPLMHQAVLSECYCIDIPGSSLTELRLFGELLAKNIAAWFGIYTDSQSQLQEMLKDLKH